MKTVRIILLLALGAFLLYAKLTSVSHAPASVPASAPAADSASPSVQNQSVAPVAADESIPAKVLQVLQVVRSTGQPPDGYVGGRVFENKEGHLPSDGDYREFDVDPHVGGRNAERIIVEWNTKKAWYTADHYQTFTPLP